MSSLNSTSRELSRLAQYALPTKEAATDRTTPMMTASMVDLLKQMEGNGSYRTAASLSQAEESQMRALIARGYAEWHISSRRHTITDAGRAALEKAK